MPCLFHPACPFSVGIISFLFKLFVLISVVIQGPLRAHMDDYNIP